MYDSKKRLVVLLCILGALVLGVVGYSFIYGINMKNEQQYARERAEAAQYIADTGNWREIENNQVSSIIGVLNTLYSPAEGTGIKFVDSDNDTYPDEYELLVGTDPNKAETFTKANPANYELSCEQAKLTLKGTPDIASAKLNVNQYNKSRNAGFGSKIYELIYTGDESNIFDSELSIEFKIPEGQDAANAVINQITANGKLTPVDTKVDAANRIAVCKPNGFGSYVVVFEELLDFKLNSTPAVVLSIDDSGSMYYYNGDDDCNNDPELFRYDLCTDLIHIARKDAIFSMNYFAGEVYEGFGFDEKEKFMKGFIADLKKVPEEEKTFTGTALGSALAKSVNDVLSVQNPSKFILCLTDGESTEGYDKWDAAVQKCRDENITLIIIGLGDDVDTERLSADAVSTGGYYLNAKDAGCIETITDSIVAVIQNKGIQTLNIRSEKDENTIINTYLLADSGFDKTKHSLSYGDYHIFVSSDANTIQVGTQSAGIAELQRQWYLGKLTSTLPAPKVDLNSKNALAAKSEDGKLILPLTDCDITKIESAPGTDLAEIVIPTIRAVQEYNAIIDDYVNAGVNMHVQNNCLNVNHDEIPAYINQHPERFFRAVVELKDTKYYTDAKHKKLEFNQIVVYYPNITYFIENDLSGQDDYLVRVIYNLFTQQLTSGAKIDYFSTAGADGNTENSVLLDAISEKLLHGDPCVIAFDTTGIFEAAQANHSVNAVALYRSCDDARVYFLKCSDNNIPDQYLYFKIDTADPQRCVITDLWRMQQTYLFGEQTVMG